MGRHHTWDDIEACTREVSTLHKQFLEMRRMRDMGVLSLSEWDNWLSRFSARFDELLKMSDEIVAEQARRKAEFEAGKQQKAAFSRTFCHFAMTKRIHGTKNSRLSQMSNLVGTKQIVNGYLEMYV